MPDHLLPQPPPDAPAPGPGEQALRSQRKLRWLIGAGVGTILLMCLPARIWVIHRAKADAIETESNLRELGMALREFDLVYGKYPSPDDISGNSSTMLRQEPGDNSSNMLFTKLFVSDIALSENMFYARAKSTCRPDNLFQYNSNALEHGECAFAYIYGLSSKDAGDTPLVFGPVIPGTRSFDRSANYGNVLILTIDNSLIRCRIDVTGKITVGGMDFFDPRQPFWHGKVPDVKWPK